MATATTTIAMGTTTSSSRGIGATTIKTGAAMPTTVVSTNRMDRAETTTTTAEAKTKTGSVKTTDATKRGR